MQKKILIIGKTPPPIGGVTIHVNRLIEHLKLNKVNYRFIELSLKNTPFALWKVLFFKTIHLHSSSSVFKVILSIYCYVLRRNLIVTNHGDLGRYRNIKDRLDNFTIRLSSTPILLNNHSFKKGRKLNPNAQLISAFIPPLHCEELPISFQNKLNTFKNKYQIICCTNASIYNYDADGKDIYGIEELLEAFKNNSYYGLIISDSSGQYYERFSDKVSSNICFFNQTHSFYSLLKQCDISIRNTTTDGDALSVKESLYLGVKTLATDCVSRPEGVIIYKHFDLKLLEQPSPSMTQELNGFPELLDIYKSIV